MDEREKRKKILFTILGIIVLILLFFWVKSCNSKQVEKPTTKEITSIDLKTESINLIVGESEKLSYTIIPSTTSEVTKWISSDESVVSVDSNGNIQAIKTGNAIVSLVSESGVSDYTVIKVVSKETVDGKMVTIGITEKNVNIKVGTSKKMLFDVDPIDTPYNEITWESSNNLVASVTSDGTVTGIRSGVTTITLKAILNDNSTITDSATLTVEENANLYLTSTIDDIKEGEIIRVSVAISDADVSIINGTVKAANEKVATIQNINSDANYLNFDVKGVKKGNTTLKVSATTSEGKDLSLDIPIIVIDYEDLYISSGDKEISIGESFILSGRLEPSVDESLDTICSSSSNKVAQVTFIDPIGKYNGACQVTGVTKGTSNISINIGGKKKTIKVTVLENGTDIVVDPVTPTDPVDPSNPLTPTFESIEASLSKTTYARNEAMGTLTVSMVDSSGTKTPLTDKDYVLINDFDSSTLGEKKLRIAYTKDEVTKTTTVTYTVSGGGSGVSGGTPYISPGYSGYSGDDGTTTSNGTAKFTITDFKITDDTNPVAENTYRGNIKLQANVEGQKDINFHVITVEKDDDGNIIQARMFKATEKDGKITAEIPSTIDADNVSIYLGASIETYDEWKKKGYINEEGIVTKDTVKDNNGTHEYPLGTIFDNHAMSTGLFYNSNGVTVINIKTVKGSGNNTEGTGATITFETLDNKFWYKNSDKISIKITVTPDENYKIKTLYVNNVLVSQDASLYSRVHYVSVSSLPIKVSVRVEDIYDKTKKDINASFNVQIDNNPPKCSTSINADKSEITITAWDNEEESGMLSIISNDRKNLGFVRNYKYNEDSYQKVTYTVTKAGTYTFTAFDIAGNKVDCPKVVIDNYICYRESKCGEPGGSNCSACEQAGCVQPNHTIHRKYNCKNLNTGESYIWWEDGYLEDGTKRETDANGNIKFIQELESSNGNDSKEVSCILDTKADVQCAEKGDHKGSTETTELVKNCELCGCPIKKWSALGNWKRTNDKEISALSSPNFTSIISTAESEDSECKNIIQDTIEHSCGEGAYFDRIECQNG